MFGKSGVLSRCEVESKKSREMEEQIPSLTQRGGGGGSKIQEGSFFFLDQGRLVRMGPDVYEHDGETEMIRFTIF